MVYVFTFVSVYIKFLLFDTNGIIYTSFILYMLLLIYVNYYFRVLNTMLILVSRKKRKTIYMYTKYREKKKGFCFLLFFSRMISIIFVPVIIITTIIFKVRSQYLESRCREFISLFVNQFSGSMSSLSYSS